jgi:hypothetical protein
LDVVQPLHLGSAVADPFGNARLVVSVRAQAGGTVWLQAAVAATAERSLVAMSVVQPTPSDLDDDRLPDADEIVWGTDPNQPDSDGDGAMDGIEVRRGLDPLTVDQDGDGLLDGDDVWPTVVGPFDPFVVDDQTVSAQGGSLPDPEFEQGSSRIVWQDDQGLEVWVADIDPLTGAVVPSDGRGELVDTGVTTIGWGKNGPEWVLGATGSMVTYTKDVGGVVQVVVADETPAGWIARAIPGTDGAMSPIGSVDPGDPTPKIRYLTLTVDYDLWWASAVPPYAPTVSPVPIQFSRFVPGSEVVTGVAKVLGLDQVYVVHTGGRFARQLTTNPVDHGSVFFVDAPELGGERVFFVTESALPDEPEALVIYREVRGVWTPVKTITAPPGLPYIVSPEPLEWNGRSYISFLATTGARNFDNGLAQIWIASLDPRDDFIRRVSDAPLVVRKDPEPFVGGVRPWVYYSKVLPDGRRQMRRCELGL